MDVAQVALDPVPGHAGRVAVWCADSDPLAGPPVRSRLVARGQGWASRGSSAATLDATQRGAGFLYEGWDATRLADELRPLGVTPRQIAIDGTNRNGYLRVDVLRALDRA